MVNIAGCLPEALFSNLHDQGFDHLTDVQLAVLEADPRVHDLLVLARTGSGKTIAFGLAIASQFCRDLADRGSGGFAAVILPTRELAEQVAGVLDRLYQGLGLRVAICAGGQPRDAQSEILADGFDVLVGTPGRLREQAIRGLIDLAACHCLVLDEADELLCGGFESDLAPFLLAESAPPDRRLHLVAAHRAQAVEAFSARFQSDARRIELLGEADRLPQIDIEGVVVTPIDRDRTIANVLRLHHPARALIFCTRQTQTAQLAAKLQRRGFSAVALTGALRPRQRKMATANLSSGAARVCVATDIAARGLHFDGLNLVVHAGVPDDAGLVLHRSGRAGRGARRGLAVFVVTPSEKRKAERFARQIGRGIDWVKPPGVQQIRDADVERILRDPAFHADAVDYDRTLAKALEARFSSGTITLACARLWRHAQPMAAELEQPAFGEARATGEERVWLTLEIGTLTRADMAEVLSLIVSRAGIDRADVGRIHVGTGTARFEVPAERVAAILAHAARAAGPRIDRLGAGR